MTLLSVSAIGFPALFIISDIDAEEISAMAAIPVVLFYIIGCVLAVYFFVRNLSRLTIDTTTTTINANNPNPPMSPRTVDLNKRQLRMTALAAQYLMLFLMAILSSILMMVMSYAFPLHSGLRLSVGIMDFCTNLLCIYLQFDFARKHYKRCCGCCHRRCMGLFARKTKQVIQKKLTLEALEVHSFSFAYSLSSAT